MTAAVTPDGKVLMLENRKDAQAFCAAAFGPFVLDVSQYVEIVAELMQHATDRALALKPADEGVREATIEECAKTCEARVRTNDSHNAPYNAEDRACAASIRALSTNRETK